jgi:uncharacterized protein YdiU (UPF0061 family)
MSESRRYRRAMAKQFGLLSKKETMDQMLERYRRSIQMGEMFHTQHLQDLKNKEILGSESNSDSQDPEENPYGFLGKR